MYFPHVWVLWVCRPLNWRPTVRTGYAFGTLASSVTLSFWEACLSLGRVWSGFAFAACATTVPASQSLVSDVGIATYMCGPHAFLAKANPLYS